MKFEKFVEWALYGLLALFAAKVGSQIDRLTDSVEKLNHSVTAVIVKTDWHERTILENRSFIQKHDDRLRTLEMTSRRR